MKRLFWIAIWISCYGAGRLQAQTTASFNFSAAAQPVAGWINVAGDPSVAVRTATDAASGMSISSIATTNWAPLYGACAFDGGGAPGGTFFPAAVMLNYWYQYSAPANYNAAVPQFRISGLNKDSVYTIKIAGTSTSVYISDPTRYTVAGLTVAGYIDVNNHNNTANGAIFYNVSPDSAGAIRVYANTLPATDVANVCGIQIIRGRVAVPMPMISFTSPRNTAILPEGSNVLFSATASAIGGSIAKVQFFRDTFKIAEVLTAPYTYTWVNPDPGNYTLTAKAIDNRGGSASATIRIMIESLNYFWSTTGNIATGGDTSFVGTVDSNRLAFRTKNIERVSILPTGNIGVGTLTPTAQLHTTGTVRLAGLMSDSAKTRVVVSDTSGNLFYRNATTLGLTLGDGLGQSAGAITIGDSIPGKGPYSFTANRYQYLNGRMYSIGGTANDPVTRPAFRVYDNGDLAAGATMDRSVNSGGKTGLRYYSKLGLLQLGGSDVIDTTGSRIVFQIQEGSGIVMNTDTPPNIIKGRLFGSYLAGGANFVDSLSLLTQDIIVGSNNGIYDTLANVLIMGHGTYIARGAPTTNSLISGLNNQITKPCDVMSLSGYRNSTQDTARGSQISGARNLFGGLSQLVAGQYLINKTPYGTTLGNSNVDFITQNYTGTQGTAATATIAQYPLFALGNGSDRNGTWRSNALTVLYNGRTQINTTGYTNALAQANVTPKAALEVVSTNSGVLLPKLTTAQRNAIATADLQTGLLLYNTDSSSFQFYNGGAWNSVSSGITTNSVWGQLGNAGTSPGGNFIGTTDAQRLVFKTNSVENMTILANGAVGIGTSILPATDAKLAVKGFIYTTKIKVTQLASWPDYVFKKGYQLPSLAQVEQYIAQHQHLPGVISAREVEKKGIDLGDNQATLLKKIEELTLYLIEEHKKSEEQQKEIEHLKAQNKRLDRQQQEIDQLKEMLKKLSAHN